MRDEVNLSRYDETSLPKKETRSHRSHVGGRPQRVPVAQERDRAPCRYKGDSKFSYDIPTALLYIWHAASGTHP